MNTNKEIVNRKKKGQAISMFNRNRAFKRRTVLELKRNDGLA